MNAGAAWFSSSRNDFLLKEAGAVVALLANHATKDGWHIEPEKHEEWTASVALLQEQLARKIHVLQAALSDPQLEEIETIILEYDMRRRGLRIDCVLLAPGLIVVLEFKRGEILKAHVDQIENYCVNLVEFHAETQRLCKEGLATTQQRPFYRQEWIQSSADSCSSRHDYLCAARRLRRSDSATGDVRCYCGLLARMRST